MSNRLSPDQKERNYAQGLIAPICGILAGWGAVCVTHLLSPPLIDSVLLPSCMFLVLVMIVALSVAPPTANTKVESLVDMISEADADKVGRWRKMVDVVSEQFALSPREKEVFLLLAKGRNAEAIARQLIISTHTVKTHTARIYRKLSINSQQELIDIVEDNRT